jgi:hypothetical protein
VWFQREGQIDPVLIEQPIACGVSPGSIVIAEWESFL